MNLQSKENTHKTEYTRTEGFEVLWKSSFDQLGPIIDPHITFQKSWKGLSDHKGSANINHTIVYPRLCSLIRHFAICLQYCVVKNITSYSKIPAQTTWDASCENVSRLSVY